ncbi:hypothetical protein HDU98_008601 [Podochytrium sp. JEL0797]|nr:hypothetical protein HDU98_008601 [Podochytrium sp. JEL0797]
MTSSTEGIGSYVELIAGDSPASGPGGINSTIPFGSVSGTTLIDLLDQKSFPWKAYLESYLPNTDPTSSTTCSSLTTATSPTGNTYTSANNPFLVFADIYSNASRCSRVVSETGFAADVAAGVVPGWSMYVPSLQHSGAVSTVVAASFWLQGFLEPLLVNPLFSQVRGVGREYRGF